MKLVCQTPHMVLVPLKTDISMGNDSKANARLRQLFVLIVLALTLHSSVMLLEEGDEMLEESCLGIVRLPSSPGLKQLVAKERARNNKGKLTAELAKDSLLWMKNLFGWIRLARRRRWFLPQITRRAITFTKL